MHSIGQSIKSPVRPCVRPRVQLFLSSLPPFPFTSPFPSPFSTPFHSPSPFPFLIPFPFSFPALSPFPCPFPFPLLPFLFNFPSLSLYIPFLFSFPFPFLYPLHFPFPSPPLSLYLLLSFFPCPRPCVQYLKRHISITVKSVTKTLVFCDKISCSLVTSFPSNEDIKERYLQK